MGKKGIKFVLGMAIGTAFGMAFAPKKGKELREELVKDIKQGKGEKFLKQNAKLVGKDVAKTAKEVYESKPVQEKIKQGKQEVSKIAGGLKSQLDDRTGEWVEIARERIEDFKNGVVKAVPAVEKIEEKLKEAKKTVEKKLAKAKKSSPKQSDKKAPAKKSSAKKSKSSKKK